MGAHAKYPAPHVQLLELLREAKRAGWPFEYAWELALRPNRSIVMVTHPNPPPFAIRWPTDKNDREASRQAIVWSKDGWRRAYEGAPASRSERAVQHLAGSLDELERMLGVGGLAA